jgi:hypothetical protein
MNPGSKTSAILAHGRTIWQAGPSSSSAPMGWARVLIVSISESSFSLCPLPLHFHMSPNRHADLWAGFQGNPAVAMCTWWVVSHGGPGHEHWTSLSYFPNMVTLGMLPSLPSFYQGSSGEDGKNMEEALTWCKLLEILLMRLLLVEWMLVNVVDG